MIRIITSNEKGSALILVLFLVIIITQLVAVLYLNCELNFKMAVNMEEYRQAVYAAEAGIAYGELIIHKNSDIPQEDPDSSSYEAGKWYGEAVHLTDSIYFLVSFEEEDEKAVLIRARGYYKNNCEELNKVVIIND